MSLSDDDAARLLQQAMDSVDAYYKERGIFQDCFGFGQRPAIVVIDFAYGWTDDAYAGGSRRLDGAVQATKQLLDVARPRRIPIIYTTAAYHPHTVDQPFKSAADRSAAFRAWDERACQIDARVAPQPEDLILHKENASAFFGTHLVSYLIEQRIDTLLITGCSTSACVRATATDAKSFRFRPVIISDCVGDRSAAAHVWTLFDIQARFADVCQLSPAIAYLETISSLERSA